MQKVGVILGSDSDFGCMKKCLCALKDFGVPFEARIISAHRTPHEAERFAAGARGAGFGVLIAAAGKAAHLAGVLAAYTTLPVIAVPMQSSTLDGLDSLLSMVQMPKGIPVATVAIDGAENAAILAAQILSLGDAALAARLTEHKERIAAEVAKKDAALREEVAKLLAD